MLTPDREQATIILCQELIRQQSYSGQEGQVVEVLKKAFGDMNFDEVIVDDYGSVIGHLKGKRPGKKVVLDGHIDVVPVTDPSAWTYDPFGGQLVEGRIYGRGSSDMKGAVAAMTSAAAFFARDRGKDFAGDIFVTGVVHEECFEGVAARNISRLTQPDYVIIGEASGLKLKRGQKGRAEIVVETFGKPAHSANPQEGVNAVYQAARLLEKLRQLPFTHQEVLGDGIMELTDIISTPYPGASVVPAHCRMTYDRRLLVGETREGVLEPLQQVVAELSRQDPQFKARVSYASGEETCYTGAVIGGERFFPGWLLPEDDELVVKSRSGLEKAGLPPEVSHYSFCTNGSHYCGEAGIKCIGFGPSYEHLAHIDDEYIEVDQLLGAVRGYYGILEALLL